MSSNDWKDKNLQKAIIKIWDERRICIDLIYDWIFINDGQQKIDEQHMKVVYIFELWQLKTKKLVENKMTIKGKEAENELKNFFYICCAEIMILSSIAHLFLAYQGLKNKKKTAPEFFVRTYDSRK